MKGTSTPLIRMPLSTGASAQKWILVSIMVVCMALAFLIFADTVRSAGLLFSLFFALPLLFFLFFVVAIAWTVLTSRASDIVFDDEGFAIVGGPDHGRRGEWSKLDAARVVVETTDPPEKLEDGTDKPRLYSFRIDGYGYASSDDPIEIASFRAVRRAIRQAIAAHGEKPATKPPEPTVATASCSACGAPLVPTDADEVACAYCGAKNVVPASLREAIRTAAKADRERDEIARTVGRALSEGGPFATNVALLAFWLTVTFGGALVALSVHEDVPWLALSSFASPFVFGALVHLAVTRRFALRALASGCSALTPDDPTHPPMCRQCRAPLPPSDDPTRVIVTCAYCRTTNIVGLPFGLAQATANTSEDLEAVLKERRNDFLLGGSILAVSSLVMLLGIVLTVH